MAGRTNLPDFQQDRVLIAIGADGDDALRVAARLALAPEGGPRARPVPGLAGLDGAGQCLGVHVGQHQHLAIFGVLRDDRDQAAGVEPGREGATGFEIELAAGRGERGLSGPHPRCLRNAAWLVKRNAAAPRKADKIGLHSGIMLNDVYNQRIIELAGNIPRLGRLADADASATAHSKLCGSTVTVDVKMADGKVVDFAHDVKACALGQAASSIMARNIIGATPAELRDVREIVRRMLKENGAPPQDGKWVDIRVLEPVRDYKARHASTMLTFDAVVEAIDKAGQ